MHYTPHELTHEHTLDTLGALFKRTRHNSDCVKSVRFGSVTMRRDDCMCWVVQVYARMFDV